MQVLHRTPLQMSARPQVHQQHFQLFPHFFFFQAEDGIRDPLVTGVQTCALPISAFGTLSAGRSASAYFRGRPPPEISRLGPVCAHRATLPCEPYYLRLPRTGAGSGFLAARATVSPSTDLAPDSSSALAHSFSVAPVVITSSTSKTRFLSTWLPGRVAKAPRTDSQRSSRVSTCLGGLGRVLISRTA